jgi:pyrroline-5-carboxylate reductase
MEDRAKRIGIVGGTGMLGSAILQALLANKAFAGFDIWVSNRHATVPKIAPANRLRVTADNQALVGACDIVLLTVPPAQVDSIAINAAGKLVVSLMAGVTIADLEKKTGAARVVRAMSSPAAALALAYSPWVANLAVTANDRHSVRAIFEACGTTDEISDELQIDHFTAMTGPVPGFVAYFAQCMVDHATGHGIEPQIADRAIRQLFLAGGTMLASDTRKPAEHVQAMIDYAGTTAAGLQSMKKSALSKAIGEGLMAAVDKARSL